ncbi:MAG: hypothetical protein M3Q30_12205 [Actinomycetota bacterium]|nr:hypothetical protein [Actinomycetota bacterium]
MTQPLEEAVLKRRVFFEQPSVGYDALRNDGNASPEVEAERRAESGVLRARSA